MWISEVQSHSFVALIYNIHSSDHAWGGNYLLLGGPVKGKRILGKYPNDLTSKSPLNLGRGRLLPTMSWDEVWNGISKWIGVPEADLDEILPNRRNFGDRLLHDQDLFVADQGTSEERIANCNQESADQPHTCQYDFDDYDDDYGAFGSGDEGLTNLYVYLIIVGIAGIASVAIACWIKSKKSSV